MKCQGIIRWQALCMLTGHTEERPQWDSCRENYRDSPVLKTVGSSCLWNIQMPMSNFYYIDGSRGHRKSGIKIEIW